MKNLIKQNFYLLFFVAILGVFLSPIFIKNLLPIPADTIVGLYNPFRDLYAKNYPNGIPFKNFLITDPVRQTYPWKELSIDSLSKLTLPLWNPYEMAGKPLLANFQSGVFYPLNLILLLEPFYFSWTIFVALQLFLSGVFFYCYLKNLKLKDLSCLMGAIAYTFSGFFVAWFEWGNIIHTALWLPLVLLSIDKIGVYILESKKKHNILLWSFLLVFSLTSSFFAGHIQTFFYLYIFSSVYFLSRWFNNFRKKGLIILYFFLNVIFLALVSIQLFPSLQFIELSARGIDQADWTKEGWFIPWQNLIQFIAPDFFGNPATLNYWGVWNYAEFVGYIGIIPLFFAFLSIFLRRDKKTFFFSTAALVAFIFALPTPLAPLIYLWKIPFLSSAQPTRLLFIIAFSLSILTSLGFDYFLRKKENLKNGPFLLVGFFSLIFILTWVFIFLNNRVFNINIEQMLIAKRNMLFPTFLFASAAIIVASYLIAKNKYLKTILLALLFVLLSFDQLRFAQKFEPFTKREYLFPDTKIIKLLKNDKEIFRVASTDSRIMPPNFFTHYKIQSIEGYDPLYLMSYAELIASSERKNENISPPFGFNRIITPRNIDSPIIDLLNVKYVLSLDDIKLPKLELISKEGQTRIYLNKNYFKRVFFVENVIVAKEKNEQIHQLTTNNLSKVAIIDNGLFQKNNFTIGTAEILEYAENKIIIRTNNQGDGFLVFADSYFPTWKAKIDGITSEIYKTDYSFRGIYIPKGKHDVVFFNTLF